MIDCNFQFPAQMHTEDFDSNRRCKSKLNVFVSMFFTVDILTVNESQSEYFHLLSINQMLLLLEKIEILCRGSL